jgi:hypothetical protein
VSDDVALLLAVFVGFYLVDCALLLKPTEGLLDLPLVARRRRPVFRRKRFAAPASPSRWWGCIGKPDLSLGFSWLPLKGRIVAWLNPLTPWRLQFRCPPLAVIGEATGSARIALPLHRLLMLRLHVRALAPLLVLHGAVLFGVLPYFLILDRLAPLLTFLGIAFATAVLIALACLPIRRVLRLSHLAYWSLALQAIICLPNSLNFPRKLALLAQSREPVTAWLPMAMPTTQSRIAWELQRAIETYFDGTEMAAGSEITAARQLVQKYQGEAS